jgi:hypothetical protein
MGQAERKDLILTSPAMVLSMNGMLFCIKYVLYPRVGTALGHRGACLHA